MLEMDTRSQNNYGYKYVVFLLFLYVTPFLAFGQKATIKEESIMLKTYPFGDPNPIPILKDNPKIYPYFKFEGYSHTGKQAPWNVITLENEHIQVFVMPEAGGKVWGAIDKSTGKEFIYRNEVMKHRNISMRGPWTSGGIEFNFGIIGHHPTTATPVDYTIKEHDDGSVSCIVGTVDLPSRTHWRVAITLPKDKAYFETKALWYNPTPIHQSYYNWMTAAAFATSDLEFYTPGNQYLKHSGEAMPWPYDSQNRKISAYKNNDFGPSKSYHVVGEYNDFFGGYYHDEKFGFGHWSLYEEIPGQKLWLWALSRTGGIWEDLLTDTDGQYIEFQAGRLFDQYSPGDHVNPITQTTFAPYTADTWKELWFPFNQIGGMTDVSPAGVLHVEQDGNSLDIGINALAHVTGNLKVRQNGKILHQEEIQFKPTEVFTKIVSLDQKDHWEVQVDGMDLIHTSGTNEKLLKRPFEYPEITNVNAAEQLYVEGMELMEYREFAQARKKLEACLEQDGSNQRALIALGELHFRSGRYAEALGYAQKALAMDTYNPKANYTAGIIYRAQGDLVNSLESLGWAARSMEFRSGAYAQMAEIYLQRNQLDLSELYAQKALDYNRFNINAYQVQAIVYRRQEDKQAAEKALSTLLDIDPLNHFAHYERSLWDESYQLSDHFRGEFPEQNYFELGIDYFNRGQQSQAAGIFQKLPEHPVSNLWMAYLSQADNTISVAHMSKALEAPVDFVFPFRRETLPILEWASNQNSNWKLKYYLGLSYWGKDRIQEASKLFEDCELESSYAPFYIARADLLHRSSKKDKRGDLQKALALAPKEWRTYSTLIQYYDQNEKRKEALALATKAYKKFPANYNLGTSLAKAQLKGGQYKKCLSTLKGLNVLPFEGASEGRVIYQQAHMLVALDLIDKKDYEDAISTLKEGMEWPENLGVGMPYDPDNRPEEFLLAYCYNQLNKSVEKEEHLRKTADFTKKFLDQRNPNAILGLLSLRDLGQESDADKLFEEMKTLGMGGLQTWMEAHYRNGSLQTKEMEAYQGLKYQILNSIAALAN